jgi:hypothetical protein
VTKEPQHSEVSNERILLGFVPHPNLRAGPDRYNAIVVDGVTMRGGQRVVAIRDPAGRPNGGVYYETVSSFQNRLHGDVIRIVP